MLLYGEQIQDLLSSTLVSRLQITLRAANRGLSNDDSRGKKPRTKKALALFQTSSLLFSLEQFVKCWQMFLVLNSKGLYRLHPNSEKEKGNRCRGTGRILNRLKIIAFWCSVQTEPP